MFINGQRGYFDYSRFSLPDLDEHILTETLGLNGGDLANYYGTRYYCMSRQVREVINANGPIDWNCNGSNTDTAIQSDINQDIGYAVLKSYEDWTYLVFSGGAIGQTGVTLPSKTPVEELTLVQDARHAYQTPP